MVNIKPPAFQHLFTLEAALAPSLDAGEGPLGRRVLNAVSEGRFYGERLKGRINPGTGDWMLTRNGIRIVDARIVLLCDDNAIIHMSYGGRIWFDDAVLPALANPATRHLIDPSQYYFRTNPVLRDRPSKVSMAKWGCWRREWPLDPRWRRRLRRLLR